MLRLIKYIQAKDGVASPDAGFARVVAASTLFSGEDDYASYLKTDVLVGQQHVQATRPVAAGVTFYGGMTERGYSLNISSSCADDLLPTQCSCSPQRR
mgnify:CR=1 FL=1